MRRAMYYPLCCYSCGCCGCYECFYVLLPTLLLLLLSVVVFESRSPGGGKESLFWQRFGWPSLYEKIQ